MSMLSLERQIVQVLKMTLNNDKIRIKDMQEWRTGTSLTAQEGEVAVYLKSMGVTVCVKKELDKREKKK